MGCEGHHGHLPSYTEDLFSYRNSHLPPPIHKRFFPDDAALSYLLSIASGLKYMQLYFESVRRIRFWCNFPSWAGGGGGNRRTNPREKFSIQTGLRLRYTTWTQLIAIIYKHTFLKKRGRDYRIGCLANTLVSPGINNVTQPAADFRRVMC